MTTRWLTFDCFGTLVDWETGLSRALRTALPGSDASDDELLERYADHESAAERPPYRPYRVVMATAARGVAADLGQPLEDEGASVAASLPSSSSGCPRSAATPRAAVAITTR